MILSQYGQMRFGFSNVKIVAKYVNITSSEILFQQRYVYNKTNTEKL